MDILYILGTRSVWQNNEIRFSLRAAEKNIKDLERVFVVGEKADWFQNIEHIAMPDSYGIKWRNAYTKTLEACQSPILSNDFLLMNDDFFIIKPVCAYEYPFYYSSIFSKNNSLTKARFLTTPENTARNLPRRIKDVRNFAVHRPVRINKAKYLAMPRFDLAMVGFSPRSFYCNFYNVPGVQCPDINLSPRLSEQQIEKIVKYRTDISIFSDTARSPIFREWLQKQFPKPSRFEKE